MKTGTEAPEQVIRNWLDEHGPVTCGLAEVVQPWGLETVSPSDRRQIAAALARVGVVVEPPLQDARWEDSLTLRVAPQAEAQAEPADVAPGPPPAEPEPPEVAPGRPPVEPEPPASEPVSGAALESDTAADAQGSVSEPVRAPEAEPEPGPVSGPALGAETETSAPEPLPADPSSEAQPLPADPPLAAEAADPQSLGADAPEQVIRRWLDEHGPVTVGLAEIIQPWGLETLDDTDRHRITADLESAGVRVDPPVREATWDDRLHVTVAESDETQPPPATPQPQGATPEPEPEPAVRAPEPPPPEPEPVVIAPEPPPPEPEPEPVVRGPEPEPEPGPVSGPALGAETETSAPEPLPADPSSEAEPLPADPPLAAEAADPQSLGADAPEQVIRRWLDEHGPVTVGLAEIIQPWGLETLDDTDRHRITADLESAGVRVDPPVRDATWDDRLHVTVAESDETQPPPATPQPQGATPEPEPEAAPATQPTVTGPEPQAAVPEPVPEPEARLESAAVEPPEREQELAPESQAVPEPSPVVSVPEPLPETEPDPALAEPARRVEVVEPTLTPEATRSPTEPPLAPRAADPQSLGRDAPEQVIRRWLEEHGPVICGLAELAQPWGLETLDDADRHRIAADLDRAGIVVEPPLPQAAEDDRLMVRVAEEPMAPGSPSELLAETEPFPSTPAPEPVIAPEPGPSPPAVSEPASRPGGEAEGEPLATVPVPRPDTATGDPGLPTGDPGLPATDPGPPTTEPPTAYPPPPPVGTEPEPAEPDATAPAHPVPPGPQPGRRAPLRRFRHLLPPSWRSGR